VFHQVPNRFTSGSQNVPQVLIVFLNTFPIAPQFFPKLVGLTSTSMYITCKEASKGSLIMLLLWGGNLEALLGLYVGEYPPWFHLGNQFCRK
jgi:hypothetical protein